MMMKDAMKAKPKKKSSKANKTSQQAAELAPAKLKKPVTAPLLRLAATTGKQDPLIMKSACFLAEDGARGKKFAEHFGGVGKIEKSSCSVDRELCLPKEGNAKVVARDAQRGED
jgi:hypothetical protein